MSLIFASVSLRAPLLIQDEDHDGVIDYNRVENDYLIIDILSYDNEHKNNQIYAYVGTIKSALKIVSDSYESPRITIPFTEIPSGQYDVYYTVFDGINISTSESTPVRIENSPGANTVINTVNHRAPDVNGNVDTIPSVLVLNETVTVFVTDNFLSGSTWIFENASDVSSLTFGVIDNTVAWSGNRFSIPKGTYANVINNTDYPLAIQSLNGMMVNGNVVYIIHIPKSTSVSMCWAGNYWYPINCDGSRLDLTLNYDWTGQHTFSQAPISTASSSSLNNYSLVTQEQVAELIKKQINTNVPFSSYTVFEDDPDGYMPNPDCNHTMYILEGEQSFEISVRMNSTFKHGYVLSFRSAVGSDDKCNATFKDADVLTDDGKITSNGTVSFTSSKGIDLTWTGNFWI